ncbi:MBL fold metallo-hydrolase [uncultured Desulfosarcina sp.]|uniref:MBL fold metallo-hydrolase n=1 Tax=uncultured Desulfosarcina sp. TaxID=218289 RepID=UPI0029C97524|nr:MBL fold metallo-hydrolase [uncultured Desulfosarcina sp.]
MQQRRQLYVLSNDAPCGREFGSEHGLSILVELDRSTRWLWDIGQSDLFLESAGTLGLNMETVKGAALSHGHYDHTGGLSALLGKTGFQGPIYAHPGCGIKRYKFQPDRRPESIGLDTEAIPWPPPGYIPVSGVKALDDGLTMISDIPRRPGLHESVRGYFFDLAGAHPDHVADDACLVLTSENGPVVILGCCHSGLANTLQHIRDLLGIDSIFSVVGGLHLLTASKIRLEEAVDILNTFSVKKVYPCHCTGKAAIGFLENRLPGRVFEIGTGTSVAF